MDLLQSDTAQFLGPILKPIADPLLESLGAISEGVVGGVLGAEGLVRGADNDERLQEVLKEKEDLYSAVSPI